MHLGMDVVLIAWNQYYCISGKFDVVKVCRIFLSKHFDEIKFDEIKFDQLQHEVLKRL